jgi:hypothetical protein
MVKLEDHVVEVDGSRYIKYAGLVALAHERGLAKLSVQVVRYPCPENESTAVVMATAELQNGATFTELGDASPASVGDRRLTPHLLRVAATRAKARCLRDALAVPLTAVEELALTQAPSDRPTARSCDPATPNQLRVLRAQAARLQLPPETRRRLESLTKREASSQIRSFNDALRSTVHHQPADDGGGATPTHRSAS